MENISKCIITSIFIYYIYLELNFSNFFGQEAVEYKSKETFRFNLKTEIDVQYYLVPKTLCK